LQDSIHNLQPRFHLRHINFHSSHLVLWLSHRRVALLRKVRFNLRPIYYSICNNYIVQYIYGRTPGSRADSPSFTDPRSWDSPRIARLVRLFSIPLPFSMLNLLGHFIFFFQVRSSAHMTHRQGASTLVNKQHARPTSTAPPRRFQVPTRSRCTHTQVQHTQHVR